MVYREEERERDRERGKSMERSKPLHNFPMDLKWGNRKLLRCMNVNSNGEVVPATATNGDRKSAVVERRMSGQRVEAAEFERGGSSDRVKVRTSSPSPVKVDGGSSAVGGLRIGYDGIEALRKELMFDLTTKADKMKDVLREGLEKEEKEEGEMTSSPPAPAKSPTPPLAETDGGASRPWNLRTRRAACKAPMNGVNGGGSGGGNGDGGRSSNVDVSRKPNNSSPLRNESRSPNSGGGGAAGAGTSGQKRERAKLSCTLSRDEIEQDFQAMGLKLSRRPKKRPRAVQKILENLAPAIYLTEVTPELYKVPDVPENGKK